MRCLTGVARRVEDSAGVMRKQNSGSVIPTYSAAARSRSAELSRLGDASPYHESKIAGLGRSGFALFACVCDLSF
jgi:phage tail tape-measure protein